MMWAKYIYSWEFKLKVSESLTNLTLRNKTRPCGNGVTDKHIQVMRERGGHNPGIGRRSCFAWRKSTGQICKWEGIIPKTSKFPVLRDLAQLHLSFHENLQCPFSEFSLIWVSLSCYELRLQRQKYIWIIIAIYPYWKDEIAFKKGGTIDIF